MTGAYSIHINMFSRAALAPSHTYIWASHIVLKWLLYGGGLSRRTENKINQPEPCPAGHVKQICTHHPPPSLRLSLRVSSEEKEAANMIGLLISLWPTPWQTVSQIEEKPPNFLTIKWNYSFCQWLPSAISHYAGDSVQLRSFRKLMKWKAINCFCKKKESFLFHSEIQ